MNEPLDIMGITTDKMLVVIALALGYRLVILCCHSNFEKQVDKIFINQIYVNLV